MKTTKTKKTTKPKQPKKAAPEKKLAPPDWSNHRVHSSSEAGDLWDKKPRPFVLRWPNDQGDRREVNVKIWSWKGTSFGANHYYAEIELERNQVWDGEEICWFRPSERSGRDFVQVQYRAEVLTKEEALKFVELVLTTFYSDTKTYVIRGRDLVYEDDEDGDTDTVMKSLRKRLLVPPLDGD